MVDFGSDQGRSLFATGGVAVYVEDCKKVRTPAWAKRCYLGMKTDYLFRFTITLSGSP